MDGALSTTLPGMPHDPAGRLAAHAAALQQPGPHIAHGFQAEISQQARASPVPDVANWAADFSRFSNHQRPQQQHPAQPMQMNHQPNFQSAFGPAFGAAPMFGAPGAFMPNAANTADFDKEMSQWMSSHGNTAGNMSEVDAAMDQMARELELNEAALPVDTETAKLDEALAAEVEASQSYTDLDAPEIGNLSLREQEVEPVEGVDAAKGKSAVSEAAERLLESVQHEDGEKWQNSVFLSLMRDFRDGRKDIVDNEIRQTGDEPLPSEQPSSETS